MLQRMLGLVVGVSGALAVTTAQAAPLQLCLDKNFNAPFVYAEKIKGAGKLRGYSLELVQKILTQAQIPYQIKSLSQAEIESKVKDAKPNVGCDIVLDIAKNSALEGYLLLTSPIYSLNYDLMYNWESYMTGLDVKKLSEVNKFKICGLKNYDYGAVSKILNIQAHNTFKDIMFNVKTKECDVFIAESVSMRYGQRANQYQVPPVGCIRLAGTEKSYHIGVAKHTIGAAQIVSSMQKALAVLGKEVTSLAEEYDINPTPCQQTFNIH